uniref:Coiled-coil domain-containing protein 127-like n=1 Tax=Paramormyrops kingsleyae TaxID=1676925 RepID=A0A3B3TH96_9TELE|nr:coiled-coil domain-containing protein 127-like [Paramormyrops kingsleyae]
MNNQKDHTRPDEGGNGGSNEWKFYNHGLQLFSAIIDRIWDTVSQRKIQQVKDQNAHLELELEKERQLVKDYQQAMASLKEKIWETKAKDLLHELEQGLLERQDAYCSNFSWKRHRLRMVENHLFKMAQKPLARELNIENDLKNIFRNDCHCARFTNRDKHKNGSLMWDCMKNWEQYVKQQKEQKRAEWSMGATQPHQDPAGSRTRT